jgi:hypothetical protein
MSQNPAPNDRFKLLATDWPLDDRISADTLPFKVKYLRVGLLSMQRNELVHGGYTRLPLVGSIQRGCGMLLWHLSHKSTLTVHLYIAFSATS